MSSNVRVNWVLPTTRVGGGALAVSDIGYTSVQMAIGAAAFTEVAKVTAPAATFLQTELEAGTYKFRLVVVDKQSPAKSSVPVDGAIVLASAAPAPVTGVTVVVE